jgi:hypothetical protein
VMLTTDLEGLSVEELKHFIRKQAFAMDHVLAACDVARGARRPKPLSPFAWFNDTCDGGASRPAEDDAEGDAEPPASHAHVLPSLPPSPPAMPPPPPSPAPAAWFQ